MINKFRFCLPHSQSPTYFNISKNLQAKNWRSTCFAFSSHFGVRHFQFDSDAAACLEFKDKLARLIAEHCPAVMPVTYCIDDQSWPVILNQLTDDKNIWILKPAYLNNGRHIKIFSDLQQLEAHYLSSKRLGGPHVLQQYITAPHLLKGHKYTIRMFVVLTNYGGAYLYPHGYFNVAREAYQPTQCANLNPHLTNEHLHHDESNVIQIPTQQFDFFPMLYVQIKAICAAVMISLQREHPTAFTCSKNRTLAIFGLDFIADSNMHLWLLEANHGPCFPTHDDHPLQKYLYQDFWRAFTNSFVLPIATHQPENEIAYHAFDPINMRYA